MSITLVLSLVEAGPQYGYNKRVVLAFIVFKLFDGKPKLFNTLGPTITKILRMCIHEVLT